MELEKEITVQIETDYENLHNILTGKGFATKDIYQLNDIYMIDKNVDIKNIMKMEK